MLAGHRRAAGIALAAAIALAFLAITVDVDLSPRLQRGNWRDLAKALRVAARGERAITTVELGSAPLEYYLPGLHGLREGSSVRVSEIDETGYAPLRASAGEAARAGLSPARPAGHRRADRLPLRLAAVPRLVSEAALRRHVITLATPEVLVPERRARVIVTRREWERVCATVVFEQKDLGCPACRS